MNPPFDAADDDNINDDNKQHEYGVREAARFSSYKMRDRGNACGVETGLEFRIDDEKCYESE